MTQTASTRMLKNFRNTFGKFLPTPVQALIPLDWRGCRALAGRAHDPPYFYRDFCPKDHHIFPADDQENAWCLLCKKNTRFKEDGRPARQALFYLLKGYMKRLLSSPALKAAITSWPDRCSKDKSICDACDAASYMHKYVLHTHTRCMNA